MKKSEWLDVARENGICDSTFNGRLESGWTAEKAATKPTKQKSHYKHPRDFDKWLTTARANGIGYGLYWRRVVIYFWDPELAATQKPLNSTEKMKHANKIKTEYAEIRNERLFKDPKNLFKLTPQHMEIARNNGIGRCTVQSRVRQLGWTVQDAISRPIKRKENKSNEYKKYASVAAKNGICISTYKWRVQQGMSIIEAATKSVNIHQHRRNDGEWIDRAISNGIQPVTYLARVRRGWTLQEAATMQPLKHGQQLNEERREHSREGFKKFMKGKKHRQ